jgi:hypothetical protein
MEQPFVVGPFATQAGPVPQVASSLRSADRWGTFKARWGVGRMHYTVDPGLYALGKPDGKAPVLVTANYKMSFDKLREALPGRDAWILVLDTKGINVWCAAGKGTFGTAELLLRLGASRLARIVSHRQLILPQLGAPGVSAHQVKSVSGFKVIYGPIEARDLPAFLDAGLKATPGMRLKGFTTWERLELVPVELVQTLKPALLVLSFFFLTDSLWGRGGFGANMATHGLYSALAIVMAVLSGAVITPFLLPWLPGRAFSLKGVIPGVAAWAVLLALRGTGWNAWPGRMEAAAWFLLIPAISAFLAMNFTGASTYTSLSGVRKEMRWAVPLQIGAGVAGLGFWIGSHLAA